MPYLLVKDIEQKLDTFGADSSGLCTKGSCPGTTAAGGRTVYFVHISAASTPLIPRIPVLISGGVHAREWAPPDALVSFIAKLLDAGAAGKPAKYPAFTQVSWPQKPLPAPSATPIVYPPFTVAADAVASILDQIDLYIIPLVNPDGRAYSRKPTWNFWWWRKNRASQGIAGSCLDDHGLDQNVGVDVNRNFDICWKQEDFYDPTFAKNISTATTTCVPGTPQAKEAGETYRGASAFSEVEASNLKWLMDTNKIQFFVDVHSYGPDIVYPWGIAKSNTTDTTKKDRNFLNTSIGATRDDTYAEYIPQALQDRLVLMGGRMQDGILQTATLDSRSGERFSSFYDVKQSASGLYPTTGACDDYLFSTQFSVAGPPFDEVANPPERYAYTIECGSSRQGLFWPQYDHEFPKIEREVHAALWSLLTYIASPLRAPNSSWPIQPTP